MATAMADEPRGERLLILSGRLTANKRPGYSYLIYNIAL
jgi:hypothetical protein